MTPKDTPHTATQGASELGDLLDRYGRRYHEAMVASGKNGTEQRANDARKAIVEYALAQRQPAPADPQATSQEAARCSDGGECGAGGYCEACPARASQEAREYPPLPQAARTDFHWIGDPNPRPYFTAEQMRSYVDSDRKAGQQEALDVSQTARKEQGNHGR